MPVRSGPGAPCMETVVELAQYLPVTEKVPDRCRPVSPRKRHRHGVRKDQKGGSRIHPGPEKWVIY